MRAWKLQPPWRQLRKQALLLRTTKGRNVVIEVR
jgi:hypothetical protein